MARGGICERGARHEAVLALGQLLRQLRSRDGALPQKPAPPDPIWVAVAILACGFGIAAVTAEVVQLL